MSEDDEIHEEEIHGSTAYRERIEQEMVQSSKMIQTFSDRNAKLVMELMDRDKEVDHLKYQLKRIIGIAQETHIKDEEHG